MSEDDMNAVEIMNALRNVAQMSKALYDELLEQGFDKADALKLTSAYLHGTAGGKLSS